MKVITESDLRNELRTSTIETYYLDQDIMLTPAAIGFLKERKINVVKGSMEQKKKETEENSGTSTGIQERMTDNTEEKIKKPKYIDYETGAYYYEKPEHMTQLYDNFLVTKDHPRICLRGKVDSLQALVVLDQTILAEMSGQEKIIRDLDEILKLLYEIMGCDVFNKPLVNEQIIGLTHAEIREHSHNPMKYYKIKQMILPNYSMGKVYAMLNQLRAAIREVEVSAAEAFHNGKKYERMDIIEAFNRLSSVLHIMICRYLADDYNR
ncbi:ATP-binding protein [Aminipila terrae]|uniref:ATP-binding protein n=1 Tax=Aminipila terrae TaxID=2697030 RepID=A0A6P1MBB3_9FIRM|nr:ATP-binding protein [Aminipila terrae]QHI71141.1 ATP-binding protein [Aminipila terrae]